MSETATVEVLTAEVRVLMVGSRQVTLSVARQLDQVPLEAVEPFGRVRVRDADADQVIGRSRKDGSLVLANFTPLYRVQRTWIDAHDLDPGAPSLPVVCTRTCFVHGSAHVQFEGRDVGLISGAYAECGNPHQWGGSCGHWDPGAHRQSIRAAIAEHDRAADLHEAAAALPLIVLAGLR